MSQGRGRSLLHFARLNNSEVQVFSFKDHNQAIQRTILFLTLLLASSLAAFSMGGNAPSLNLKEKEIKKGAELIAKLRLLEELTDNAPDFKTYGALMNKLSPNLFIKASELAESDLKTDLVTAIFLYDEALRRYNEPERAEKTVCLDEARVTYRKLCANAQNKTVHELLWAKARLHTSWAMAVINYNRGAKDDATIAALKEMQTERANDLMFGEQAAKTLQALEKEVCAYTSLREFEEHGSLAHVSFDQLSQDVADALPVVDRSLRSLPRSPLFYALYHARNSYLDGLFWWRKTYRQKEMVVNVSSFTEADELKSTRMDSSVVNYTVAINWRKAINHTREALKLIEAARANLNDAK
jgi:hypothetical protein